MNNNIPDILTFTASRINFLRSECGYSTRELADKSGIANSTLSKITHKNVIPNICTLHSICKGLNITLSDFFFGSEYATSMTFKEAKLIERFRKLTPMSQDTLIKLAKCMR